LRLERSGSLVGRIRVIRVIGGLNFTFQKVNYPVLTDGVSSAKR